MSLVPCPECKVEVSRSATSCPRCGFPFGAATGVAAPPVLPGHGPPAGEQILWEGAPSLKALAVTIAATLLFAVALPVAVYLAYSPVRELISQATAGSAALVAEHEDDARRVIILIVVAVVAARAARLGWRMLALRSHHYTVSNQRIKVEDGVFSKALAEIDVRTIDDITFRQTFVERLCGVGQIAIVSSDPARARITLLGVANPREIRELIRNSAYQATRGQLFTRST